MECHHTYVNTTSTQLSADKESITPQSTIPCVECSPSVDGIEANCQFGKKTIPMTKKFKTTSTPSQITLKRPISTACQEYSKNLNINFTSKEELFDNHDNSYDVAMENCRKWQIQARDYYNTKDYISIISMLCYLKNRENGFGHRNDEEHFQRVRQSDKTGDLYREALKGFELSKKRISLKIYKK